MKMIGISSSWFAIKGLPIRESIENCFKLGFDLVEIGAAHEYEDKAVETVLELRKKYPNKAFTIHALFPHFKNGEYPLNLSDPKEHDRTLKIVKKMFDIADRVGSPIVGIHGGYLGEVRWVKGKHGFKELKIKNPIPFKIAKRNMKVILDDLVGVAEERNIKLAIEISPAGESKPMMTTPESFEWMFTNYRSKHLGLLLDIGHLHLASRVKHYDPYDFVRKFKSKLLEVHLHDCKDGADHFAVGTGEIDFKKYFKIIGRPTLEKIPLVFEYNDSVSEEEALAGKKLVESMLAEICK